MKDVIKLEKTNDKKTFLHQLGALVKSFTPYQICYLAAVLIITVAFIIIMPENMLDDTSNKFIVVCSVIACLANPVCELLISKQSKMNFLVDMMTLYISIEC